MNKTGFKKPLSSILCIVLIAAMALTAFGCNDNKTDSKYNTVTVSDGATLGEGAKKLDVSICDAEGNVVNVDVYTDKTTVGEALLDVNLIAGDDGEYGLYVKCVNGIVADYDADGKYWAFYINGEYAMTGVDTTDIDESAEYSLKVEK